MINITAYTPTDREATEQLIVELHDGLAELEPDILERGAGFASRFLDYILEKCTSQRGAIFVAKKDGAVVGMIAMRVERQADEKIDYVFISELIVTERARNQRIGTLLLTQAETYAKSIGVPHLSVSLLAKNSGAYKLYQKEGFRDFAIWMYKKL